MCIRDRFGPSPSDLPLSGREGAALCTGANHNKSGCPIYASPVSYTHLDVYKRQPLDDDAVISREPDGKLNEDYCKWCYTDGNFVYTSIDQLTDFLVGRMSNEHWPPEQARAYFESSLPKLKHWISE